MELDVDGGCGEEVDILNMSKKHEALCFKLMLIFVYID